MALTVRNPNTISPSNTRNRTVPEQARDRTGVLAVGGADRIELSFLTFGQGASVAVEVLFGGVMDARYTTTTSDGDTINGVGTVARTTGAAADIRVRRRIGGFQKFEGGRAINAPQVAPVGLTEAASGMEDANLALATANLNRRQGLVPSSSSRAGINKPAHGSDPFAPARGDDRA